MQRLLFAYIEDHPLSQGSWYHYWHLLFLTFSFLLVARTSKSIKSHRTTKPKKTKLAPIKEIHKISIMICLS